MAVGYVASASSGSQASVATFNIGTLGTGARCGIVFVCVHNSATDIITGVTWNSVAMTELYKATDTDTEPGVVKAYFLDNVTNGVITVSRTNNATVTVGYAASISVGTGRFGQVAQTVTKVSSTSNTNASTSTTGTGASGEIAVDDGSPGTSSMRFAAFFTGAATPLSAGTNSTSLQSLDSTSYGSTFVRETTAGQGSRSVGAATGTTDDWAIVAVAVREGYTTYSSTFTTDAVIAKTISATTTASAVVKTTVTGMPKADAVIQRIVSGSFPASAIIWSAIGGTVPVSAAFGKSQSGSFSASAIILKTIVVSGGTANGGLVPLLLASSRETSGGATVDAYINKPILGSFPADAIIASTSSSAFVADAVVRRTAESSFGAAAVISKTYSSSFSASALVMSPQTAGRTLDAVIKGTRSGTASADAIKLRTFYFGSGPDPR